MSNAKFDYVICCYGWDGKLVRQERLESVSDIELYNLKDTDIETIRVLPVKMVQENTGDVIFEVSEGEVDEYLEEMAPEPSNEPKPTLMKAIVDFVFGRENNE